MQSKPVDDALDLSLHGSRIHDLINNPINSRFHPRHLLVQQSTVISQHFNHLLCNSLSKYTTRVSIVSLSVNHNHVMIVTYNFIPVCISSAGFSADSCSELISKWSYRKKVKPLLRHIAPRRYTCQGKQTQTCPPYPSGSGTLAAMIKLSGKSAEIS